MRVGTFSLVVMLACTGEVDSQGAWRSSPEPPGRQEELVLTLQRAYAVPSGYDIAGGAIAPSGMLVAWSRTRPEILVSDGDTLTVIAYASNSPPIAAAISPSGDSLDVLVPGGRVLKIIRSGRTIAEEPLLARLDGEVVAATKLNPQGWAVAIGDQNGDVAVYGITSRGGRKLLHRYLRQSLRTSLPDSLARVRLHLQPTSTGEVLSTLWWKPFTTSILRAGGGPARSFSIPEFLQEAGLAAIPVSETDSLARHTLLSLPVIPLDDGYLRVMSDLGSDSRWLVRHDKNGTVVRIAALDAPFGLLAATEPGKLLLGARRTSRLELVVYNWCWGCGKQIGGRQ